jgi:hypothetical protein
LSRQIYRPLVELARFSQYSSLGIEVKKPVKVISEEKELADEKHVFQVSSVVVKAAKPRVEIGPVKKPIV